MSVNSHFVSEGQLTSHRFKDSTGQVVTEGNAFLLLTAELRVYSGHYDVMLPAEEV
jgi:hypothetical protein